MAVYCTRCRLLIGYVADGNVDAMACLGKVHRRDTHDQECTR